MRRRIRLVGVALIAFPLAFGVAASTAASNQATTKSVKVACKTTVGTMIASGETGVTPPAQQGDEYGTVRCGKLLGSGVQADTFTVPASGDTVARYTLYLSTGTIHGKYDLAPQEGTLNFLETSYLGKLTVAGGTGAFKGAKGTGTMTCITTDGIHTNCTDKLKLKP